MFLLQREALFRRFFELAKLQFVIHIGYPLLQLLIDRSEAVESAVLDEEVLLEVFHHPFHLTFGFGPSWTVGPWQEAIVIGQQQESGVEHDFPVVIFQHRSLLVINQHRFHAATKAQKALASDSWLCSASCLGVAKT